MGANIERMKAGGYRHLFKDVRCQTSDVRQKTKDGRRKMEDVWGFIQAAKGMLCRLVGEFSDFIPNPLQPHGIPFHKIDVYFNTGLGNLDAAGL